MTIIDLSEAYVQCQQIDEAARLLGDAGGRGGGISRGDQDRATEVVRQALTWDPASASAWIARLGAAQPSVAGSSSSGIRQSSCP